MKNENKPAPKPAPQPAKAPAAPAKPQQTAPAKKPDAGQPRPKR